jgi:glutamine amidotransferase
MIIIIDYGMGNLRSIQYKLEKEGIPAKVSSKAIDIEAADKFILPGVGAFASGMRNLGELGILPILEKSVIEEKKPLLGICLGMQLLSKCSEEGSVKGLGWVDAETRKFAFGEGSSLRVPHVGWNTIDILRESILLDGVSKGQRFYFTHSYYVHCLNKADVVATTDYGVAFTSVLQRENIYGTQFHPEKSHRIGLELILNFIKWA